MVGKQKIYEGKAKVIFKGPKDGTLVQYFKDENSMFYASYSDGFKSGGYEAIGVFKANKGAYGSEAVDAYEFGYKTSNDKMKMSVNYFHSEYDGNQLSQYIYNNDPDSLD